MLAPKVRVFCFSALSEQFKAAARVLRCTSNRGSFSIGLLICSLGETAPQLLDSLG